jgi:protein PhnA
MELKRLPELRAFLSTYFAETEADGDERAVQAFVAATPLERQRLVIDQARAWGASPDLSLEELGIEANRWFAEADEARRWIGELVGLLESAQAPGGDDASAVAVKDSNGAPLSEGDSVQVIKDLKVKGGSSDLKRGTLIKKIHLVGDPEAVECRVDGSTLVLKTCFLKKV